ncbi:MAG TPA: hypothetical protein VG742_24175, partial [Dongiaceae bacterium]|nr:hypothetical protein [Dongiaceae bacterium]
VDTQVAPRFECFSLKIEPEDAAIDVACSLPSLVDPEVSVLIREEYIEPYSGDATGLVGGPPRTIQQATVPGRTPVGALMSCRVAFGVLWKSIGGKLVAAADWAPFNVRVTADKDEISTILGQSEIVPVDTYVQRYGVQP